MNQSGYGRHIFKRIIRKILKERNSSFTIDRILRQKISKDIKKKTTNQQDITSI